MERITVSSHVDAKIFKSFAYFDVLKRKKSWRSPALFMALMMTFSIVCFSQSGQRQGAVLLGTVLGTVAVIIPFSYFFTFDSSLNKQVIQRGITRPKVIYNVELNEKGIEVSNEKESAQFEWSGIDRIYYVNDCVYLYVTPQKAFLLPKADIKCGVDTLWEFFEKRLPNEKLFRKKAA